MSSPIDSHTQWMDHLSQNDLREFPAGTLPPDRMLACDEHLSSCDQCRGSLANEMNADQKLGVLMDEMEESAAKHLTYDETRLLAEGKLAPAHAQQHLIACARCAAEVADLRGFVADISRAPREAAPRKSTPAYGAIAAGLLIGVLGIGYWYHNHQQGQIAAVPAPSAQVADVTPAPTLPPEYQALVAQTTTTGRLPISDAVAGAQKDEILLGEKIQPPPFRVLSPNNVVVLDDRPVFTWQPASGAASYKVAVYDSHYRKVAESDVLHAATWQSSVPLKRDALYSWSVTAVTSRGVVRTPAPPQPEVHFKVMSAVVAQRLHAASEQYPDQHLLLAALYAKEGDLGLASCQLDALAKSDPTSDLVKNLRASLAAKCVTLN